MSFRHPGFDASKSRVHRSLNTSEMWHPPNTYRESPTSDTVCPARDGGLCVSQMSTLDHVATSLEGFFFKSPTFARAAAGSSPPLSAHTPTSSTQVSLKQCWVFEPPNKMSFPRHATALCPHRASGTPFAALAATTVGSSHVSPRCVLAALAIGVFSSPCKMQSEFENPSKNP